MLQVQPQHGPHPQLLHLVVHVAGHPVQLGGGQLPLPGQVDHTQAHHVDNGRRRQHQAGEADVQPLEAQHPAAEDAQQDDGQQQHQDDGDTGQHGGHDHIRVVGQAVARRHAQAAEGVVGLEDLLGDELHDEHHADCHRQELGHQAVHRPPEGQGEQGAEQAPRHGEDQVDGQIGQIGLHVKVEDHLQVEQQGGEQEHPGHGLPEGAGKAAPASPPAPAPAAVHSFSAICHGNKPPELFVAKRRKTGTNTLSYIL